MDYGAAAAKYVDAFFANVEWDEVNRRDQGALKAASQLDDQGPILPRRSSGRCGARLRDETPRFVHLAEDAPGQHASHAAVRQVVDDTCAERLFPVGDDLEPRIEHADGFVTEVEEVRVEERQMASRRRPRRPSRGRPPGPWSSRCLRARHGSAGRAPDSEKRATSPAAKMDGSDVRRPSSTTMPSSTASPAVRGDAVVRDDSEPRHHRGRLQSRLGRRERVPGSSRFEAR